MGRIGIAMREFAAISSPPFRYRKFRRLQEFPGMRFSGIAESTTPMGLFVKPGPEGRLPLVGPGAQLKNATEGARSAHRLR